MTLGQMRTAVQARGYASDTATEQTDLINSVYRELWSSRPWSWLEASQTIATVSGTLVYTPSPAAQFPLRVWIASNRVLEPLPPDELIRLYGSHSGTAPAATPPQYWSWIAKQINVYPVPGAVFTLNVHYIKQPADLAADSDTPSDLPSQYHDILVWGAVTELAYRERDHASYDRALARFERRLAALNAQEDTLARVRNRDSRNPAKLAPPAWDPLAQQLAVQQG